jgi:hypothetical protein
MLTLKDIRLNFVSIQQHCFNLTSFSTFCGFKDVVACLEATHTLVRPGVTPAQESHAM